MSTASRRSRLISWLPYALIVLASIAAFLPFLSGESWFKSHDATRYALAFSEFKESFLNGQIYPRWQANMYGGYGYPSFSFYQPGYFYLLLLLSAFVDNAHILISVSLMALFAIGGTGAYQLCRRFADAPTGLILSGVFLCTPYIFVNLFVRGDLSELAAMLTAPWAFFFLLALKESFDKPGRRGCFMHFILLALSSCAVIMTHPAVALFLLPCLGALSFALCIKGKTLDTKLLRVFAGALLWAVVLASPYWITLFQMKPYANFKAIGNYFTTPQDHVVFWKQFFSSAWGYTYSNAGPQDGMSFQLGAIHFLLAALGFFLGRKNIVITTSFALYIGLILLMSPVSAWLWQHAPLIGYIQFPWRLLANTALLQLVCMGGIGLALKNKNALIKLGVAAALAASILIVHREQFIYIKESSNIEKIRRSYQKARLLAFTGLNSENEFLPHNANIQKLTSARKDKPMVHLWPDGDVDVPATSTPYRIRVKFSTDSSARLIINQFYFPGWAVVLNGKRVSPKAIEASLSPAGLISLAVGPGDGQTLEAHYDGPPYRRSRTVIVLLLSAGILLYTRRLITTI